MVFVVVHQNYEPRVIDEDVLRGNAAIVKCLIPSFVSDYVQVVEWVTDDESLSAFSLNDSAGNYGNQDRSRVPNCPYPLYTKSRLILCTHTQTYEQTNLGLFLLTFSAVNQFYESQVYDIYVIRGNAAVFKCHIPSFVSDHVHVVSWHDSEDGEFLMNENYGISLIILI